MPEQENENYIDEWSKLWKPWRPVMRKTRKRGYIPRGVGLHGFQADPQLMDHWFGGLTDGIYQWMVTGACGEDPEIVYIGMTSNSLRVRLSDYNRSDSIERKNINQALEDNKQLHARVLLRSDTDASDARFMWKVYTSGRRRLKWNGKK